MFDLIIVHDADGTIHAEPLIRCKDCQHNDEDFPCERHTLGAHAVDDENWFCADGQMKEG